MQRSHWMFLAAVIACTLFFSSGWERTTRDAAAKDNPKQSCKTCHSDFSSLLQKNHPKVTGATISACLPCHAPDMTGKAKPSKFSTRIHVAHVALKGTVDCGVCHNWIRNKSFGLHGWKGSWGKPTNDDMDMLKESLDSWATGTYMDSLHAKANVTCAGCHGNMLPKSGDTLDNSRCLDCHGAIGELVRKSEPKTFPDRNPHKSHLGGIDCTVCHRAHSESKAYCLECHHNFEMKQIPGAAPTGK